MVGTYVIWSTHALKASAVAISSSPLPTLSMPRGDARDSDLLRNKTHSPLERGHLNVPG